MNYPSAILSGTLVDRRYNVVKVLGQGGFGRTYLVEDKKSFDNLCVLKEFFPQATEEYAVNKSRELFEREAKVLNQLEHKQIPKFFGWFEENKKLFLVQQFVDGETYADLLQKRQQDNKTFSEEEVVQLLKDLLPVLQYIHTSNIIHRDISPDNIMLCRKAEKPILIDFGVVNQRTATQVASGAITAGTTVGKQSYSPVEQISRGICFPSSDLYALAVTAIVLLTGKQSGEFFDSNDGKWQWRRYTNVSDSFAAIIDKMSADAHHDRYQSAKEVLGELYGVPNTFIPDLPNPPQPHPTPSPNNTIAKAMLGLATVAALGGLWFTLTPNMNRICNVLNNCSSDIRFKAKYEEIVEQSKPIIAEAANDENLGTYKMSQLQDLNNRLEKIALELKVIPTDIKIANEVEQTVDDVNNQLQRVKDAMEIDIPNQDNDLKPGEMFIKSPEQ